MKSDDKADLLRKYYAGLSSKEEEQALRSLAHPEESFEKALFDFSERESQESAPPRFDQKIQTKPETKVGFILKWKWAAAAVILALAIGYALGIRNSDAQAYLQLKAGLESAGSSDRLKAIYGRVESGALDEKSKALFISSLEEESNVNVRLAIIGALENDVNGELITELIGLLLEQDSPMVQLALADLIITHADLIEENELIGLLNQEDLKEEVKNRISHAISL